MLDCLKLNESKEEAIEGAEMPHRTNLEDGRVSQRKLTAKSAAAEEKTFSLLFLRQKYTVNKNMANFVAYKRE